MLPSIFFKFLKKCTRSCSKLHATVLANNAHNFQIRQRKKKFVFVGVYSNNLLISFYEIGNWLREVTDCKKSMSISFASSESCTFDDLKKRNDKCKSYRGWKVPLMFLSADVLEKLKGNCNILPFFITGQYNSY